MIEVTCAIILKDNKVLIAQRSEKMDLPLHWEFPGGKIKNNESAEDCLKREILEELNLNVELETSLTPTTYKYSTKEIKLIPFICSLKSGNLELAEHKEVLWVSTTELMSYNWCPADIPIVKEFQQWFKKVYTNN
jgi:8-oxo-dGTP diphosphatase